MPSSTSSSDHVTEALTRPVPDKPWIAMLLVALVLCATGLGFWERHVRKLGYAPISSDTPNLWAAQRERAIGAKRSQVVFVGTSRQLFDIDLETFERETGVPPTIQLATVASNPIVIFTHLAKDETYAGTTIVDFVPGLSSAAGGPPMSGPMRYTDHYDTWSVSQRWELPLSLWLQDRLALLNQDDLSLKALLEALPLPKRPAVFAPDLPPYIASLDRRRQGRLLTSLSTDPAFQKKLRDIWIPLSTPPPPPPIFTPEQWKKMGEDGWTRILADAKKNVEAIERRGGRVIFVRHPSTGKLRELERATRPREAYWDRLLRETGAVGIHFEDHPELSSFDCPEWSHLGAEDAVEYTRRLARILKGKGLF